VSGSSLRADGPPRQEWVEPVTGMRFVHVPSGTFTMGSPPGEPGREDQERQHEVTIERGFWLGRFEVTQRQWSTVMDRNPSRFRDADGNLPVEDVNVLEVEEFLRRLNTASADDTLRLPTEAEWEYACRAGTTTAYATGARLTREQANFTTDPRTPPPERGRTMPVGTFPPNPWGLYDLHGNVWEWTADDHCPYPEHRRMDAGLACGSALKVIRGGSWYFAADSARCALRYTHRPQDRGFSLGFRVVREEE